MGVRRVHGAAPKGDPAYRQLWRLVDGAVAMTFDHHPDYLTPKGARSARTSITKRVTGLVHGYAAQVAQSRSGVSPAAVTADGVVSLKPRVARSGRDPDCGSPSPQSTASERHNAPLAELPIHGWL